MTDHKIEVSFVIPTLNEEKYLPQCLGAIRQQDMHSVKYEIIVVDNGSTDKSLQIAKDYGARIFSAPGKTVAALRNVGARNAKGEYVAYVDADCVIDRHWLENAIRVFSDARVAAAGAPTTIGENGGLVERCWFLQRQRGRGIESVKWLPTENLIIRKSVLDEVGGFNEALISCEDADLGYKISRSYKILSDPAIRSLHLGEARTLGQFYRKEKWRGQGNLRGLFSHGIILDELPSLLFPLYYLITFLLFPLEAAYSLVTKDMQPLTAGLLMTFAPIALLSLRTTLRTRNWKAFLPLCLLYLVYAMARTDAILPRKTVTGHDRPEQSPQESKRH